VAETNGGPPVIEGPGRYIVHQAPDGGWRIDRTTGLCDRCLECGCGERAEPIMVPAMVISIATSGGFSLGKLKDMAKGLRAK
jgi:hypothetical protein